MQEMQLHAICMLDSHSIFPEKNENKPNLTHSFNLLSLSKWKEKVSNDSFSNTMRTFYPGFENHFPCVMLISCDVYWSADT